MCDFAITRKLGPKGTKMSDESGSSEYKSSSEKEKDGGEIELSSGDDKEGDDEVSKGDNTEDDEEHNMNAQDDAGDDNDTKN